MTSPGEPALLRATRLLTIESPTSPVRRGTGQALEMSRLLDAVAALGRNVLESEENLPDPAFRDPERLDAHLDLSLGSEGIGLDDVLSRLSGVLQATPSSSSWRFLNQLFGGRVPVATAAEMLAALPNVSMYTYKAAGAQVLVEREVLRRMAAKVGFKDGEGCFTPGGSLANLVALLLARNEDAPESRDEGVAAPRWTIYTSEEGHYSIPKAAGILGLGRRNVRRIPVRPDGSMSVPHLAEQMARDRDSGLRPLFVNATAGTTVRGAFDPIREIAAVAHAHGAWLHVDEIKISLTTNYGELNEDWKFYGQKIGWTLKLLYKKRNLFFVTPYENYFQIAFVFGDKAVAIIERSDFPKNIIEEIKNARKYAEGRGLRIAVKKPNDIKLVLSLTEIKISN